MRCVQDYRVRGGGSVGRTAVSASIVAGVGLAVLCLGASWLVHRRRRRRAASAAAAAAEAADNDGRDANSTDNAAFSAGTCVSHCPRLEFHWFDLLWKVRSV